MKNPAVGNSQITGSSLVVSLLVLIILSTIVVAFLQSMAIERITAKSHKNILQAELAAQAGLHAAIAQIQAGMGTNSFVTGLTNFAGTYSVTLIGRTNLTDPGQLMPLVSGPSHLLVSFPSAAWGEQLDEYLDAIAVPGRSVDVNSRRHYLQTTANTNLYRAAWVFVTNATGTPNARYAFVVLDEMARVNPILHDGSGSRTNATNWYSGPKDLSLTNTDALLLTRDQVKAVSAFASAGVSSETLALSFASEAEFQAVKHLLTAHSNPSYDVIPAWLPNGGKAKYNINDLATNPLHGTTATARSTSIAEIIGTHLTNFSSRDPSLRENPAARRRYLDRLSASIVDYIDADSSPTFTASGEPAGRDLFPSVAAIAERTVLTALQTNRALATFESRFFVQLWNPYLTHLVLTNTALHVANRPRLNFGTGIIQTFSEYAQTNTSTISLRPNEFVVIEYPAVTQTFAAPPSTNFPFWGHGTNSFDTTDNDDQTTWLPFRFFAEGNLVDMSRRAPVGPGSANSGLTRSFKRFTAVGAPHYQVNFIPTQPQGQGPWRSVGDPRATFLCNYDWGTPLSSDNAYASLTRWNGRQSDAAPRYQDFVRRWVHRDYVPRNPSEGHAPGSVNKLPTAAASGYSSNDASSAIAFLRNGVMRSLGELGHVFDPVQADDVLVAPAGGSPASPYVAAGGRTLRIGQPEFATSNSNTWNTNGRRAIELLDLFTVNASNSTGLPVAIGRINPNTASPEVLRAALSGILITSDAEIAPARLTNIKAGADQIIANRPYSSLSDLHKALGLFAAGTNYSPPFSSQIGGGTTNLSAMDRVREEAFGKLIQHLAVQSRTYRIVVIGETLDAQGKPRARSVVQTIVHFETLASGKVVPRIQHQRYLQ